MYHLCRHGNYSCTEPILTNEELELMCVSGKYKCISAESNLEVAAFINLILVKILVYNVILAPEKVSSDLTSNTIVDNL